MFILTDRNHFLERAVGPGEWVSTTEMRLAKKFSTVAKARKFLDTWSLRGVLVTVESPTAPTPATVMAGTYYS